MAQIISATTRFGAASHRGADRAGAGGDRQRQEYNTLVLKAQSLLNQAAVAAAAADFDEVLELSYQAGLRTAGARVALTPVAARKRKPSSVWQQLHLVGGVDSDWAREFERFSRHRSRLLSGLDDRADQGQAVALHQLATEFYLATIGSDIQQPPLSGGAAA